MVTTKFDTSSKLHLAFPDKNKPLEIVSTVEAFLDYETSLPPEEQLPQTSRLTELLEEWIASDDMRSEGEYKRAVAAETVEQLDSEMVRYVRRMRKTIDAAFPESPAEAKAWGFNAKHATKNILLPRTRKEHLMVLNKYIAKEQSRPEEEQFTSPPLTEVIEIRDRLRKQLNIRSAGQTQREEGAASSNQITLEMYDQLQGAVVYLLNFKFSFTLTVELQNWGFEVIARHSTSDEEEEGAILADTPPKVETVPELPLEATSINGSYINGSSSLEKIDLSPENLLGE